MPKATAYSATHQGFTFTRNSHRTYTHVVLVQQSKAEDRVSCERTARGAYHANLRYHTACAEGRNPTAARFPDTYTPERIEADRIESQAWLDLGEQGHVDAALARLSDYTATQQTLDDGDTYFTCAGWCGRLDLAGKLAGKHSGAVIVPAVVL